MDLLFNSPNLNNKAVSVWDEHIWKCRGRVGGGAACHQNSNTFPSHTERLVQLPSCFSLFFFFLETCGFYIKTLCKHSLYIYVFNSSSDPDGSDVPPSTTLKLFFSLTLCSEASLFFLINCLYD